MKDLLQIDIFRPFPDGKEKKSSHQINLLIYTQIPIK